ncbi:MAG TPA: DUF1080 domain-containing protein [Planctomycetota bacterium]|nr:DUF1080 domain-containing protein [Planctomycetota bacterium]
MRLLIAIFTLVFCSALMAGEDEGFTPLFNGKDLSGWKVPAENLWWSVADGGVLVGKQDDKLKGHTLQSEKEFQDLILESEVRWSGDVDSGFFLRKGNRWQCQIGVSRSLKKDMTCSIYVPKGGYVVKAENVDKHLKAGDWNKIRIEAKGDHYTIWLNGEKVVDTDLPGYNEPGPIGIQLHPGVKDMKVEFRNMKVKAL